MVGANSLSSTPFSMDAFIEPSHGLCFLRKENHEVRLLFACRCPHNEWHPPTGRKHPDRVVLHYVIRGAATYTDWMGLVHSVEPGDLFLSYSTAFAIRPMAPDFFQQILVLDTETAKHMADVGLLSLQQPLWKIGLHHQLLVMFDDLITSMHDTRTDNHRQVFAKAITWIATAVDLDTRGNKLHPVLHKALRLMESSPRPDITVADIAAALSITASSFTALFKKEIGSNPKHYIIEARIKKACHLLLSKNIKEVSAELGYSDQFQFSKQFKARLGISPKQYQSHVLHHTSVRTSTTASRQKVTIRKKH